MGGGARAGCYAGHGTRVTGHTAPSALAPRVPRPRPSAPRQAIYLDTPISTSVTRNTVSRIPVISIHTPINRVFNI